MPNTKIVVTLGPATESAARIGDLIAAGADVFRLNASHSTQEDHARRIRLIRDAAAAADRSVAILLDLQGPKIRLGAFSGGGCVLEQGTRFVITTEKVMGDCHRASTGYSDFPLDVKPGNRVLMNDGAVELRAENVHGSEVEFTVVAGGPIGDHKGINLPGVKVSAAALTPKDLDDLEFGIRQKVDLLALSFVRRASDVEDLRRRIRERDAHLPIVAKIEKPEGVDKIQEILEAADGVMVARGDLGVEIDLERVPPIQKSIIRKARRAGKFVITATQMLESMTKSPVPTRAEVSDVANAIYDGSDAVMLSAETATGDYPVEAVAYMRRIAVEAEKSIDATEEDGGESERNVGVAEALADAAYNAARAAGVAALVVFTETGASARLIARYRPPCPLYAITPSPEVSRCLSVIYGVRAMVAPNAGSTDAMLAQVDSLLRADGYLREGDLIVFVAGQPVSRTGTMNLMKIHRLGDVS